MNSGNKERFIHSASGIKVIVFGMLFLLSQSAYAQTWSLNDVLNKIEENNPLLASYHYRIDADRSMAEGARSWSAPVFGAGPYSTPYVPEGNETLLNRNEGSVMFFLEQDIPNPYKLRTREKYLNSLALVDSSDAAVKRNELFSEGKMAYIDRFMAEKRLRLIDAEIDLLKLLIQTYTNEYAGNQGDLASVYKAEARMHRLEAMKEHENSGVKEATAKMNYLMNFSQAHSFAIDSSLKFKDYRITDADTSASYLAFHKSGIQKINYTIESIKLNQSVSLSAAKPDFGIRYEHNEMFGSRNTFSLMGMITIPIAPWSMKSYKSESLSQQQQIEAMNLERQSLISEVQSEVHASLLHTIAEYEEVNHFEKEVIPAYRKAFETSLLAYKSSKGSLLFTLMAWDDLSMAQEEYLYHLEQAYKSEIAYENAIEKR